MLQWLSPWSLLTFMDWDMLTSVWVFCGGCRISLLRWFVCRRLAHFLRMSFLCGFRGLVICVLVLLVLLVRVSLQSCIVLCFSWWWRLPPSLYWLYFIPTLLCGDFNTVLDRVIDGRASCPLIWHLSWEFHSVVCFFSWLLCGWHLTSQAPRCAWFHVVEEGRISGFPRWSQLRGARTPASLLFLLQTYGSLDSTCLLFLFGGMRGSLLCKGSTIIFLKRRSHS